ncbi:MAG TPA: spore germination protein [Bacillales bacterium]|nr:spore germination protein [Bacillales bacterium]
MRRSRGNRNQQKTDNPEKPVKQAYSSKKENISYIQETLHNTSDLKVKNINKTTAIVYIETLAESEKIEREILLPDQDSKESLERIIEKAPVINDLNKGVKVLLDGKSLLFVEGQDKMRLFDTSASYHRQIQEPVNEKVIRGSHEGFIENMQININLIRKKIQNENLCVRYYNVGNSTKTNTALVFMDNLADPDVLEIINKRLKSISTDTIVNPGFIEEFIEDSPFSPFPHTLNTERPDRTIANILEGRIALISEDSPTALIMPVTFFAFYQSPDDYNSRWITGTFIRLIRLMSFIIAIGLPGFYIAISGFHFEVIPDELVEPLKASVTGIPYPPFFEAIFMVITIELIREAGIRLPTPIGQTIGIVGGLVIGNAVVMAGLISNIMIIIIALTAIASFVVPSNEMSTSMRVLTFPIILAASTFGFVGIVFALIFILIHLCRLESYGTPYFAPVAPFKLKDLKDTFVRLPIWMMNLRPNDAHPQKSKREWPSRGWKNDQKRK